MKRKQIKNLQLNVVLVFTLIICSSNSYSTSHNIDYLSEKNFYPLSKNIFINKYEISNKAYNYFLDNYAGKVNHEKLAIKNHLWTKGKFNKSYNKVNEDFYHIDEKWKKHPVVNVQQIAAKTYCKWLTETYNIQKHKQYKKVIFRLPTEKEWIKAYRKVKNQIDIRKEKLIYTKEFPVYEKECSEEKMKLKAASEDMQNGRIDPEGFQKINTKNIVDDFQARPVDYNLDTNKLKIYNLIGNVSEWLAEDNKAISSNWNTKNDKKIKELIKAFESDQASPEIGFRIVMEVIEK